MGKLSMEERLHGLLLGQAVGDAIGLPFEGIKASRVAAVLGTKPLSHRFFFGSGMVSDDTEHATMTANAILASDNNLPCFLRSLSWRLRFWGIALPAGAGLGTAKSIFKLWLGFPPTKSGVKSAGNGPCMRAPIIAAARFEEPDVLEWVDACTRITHTDERAVQGARLIAQAAVSAMRGLSPAEAFELLEPAAEYVELLDNVRKHVGLGSSLKEFCGSSDMSNGISGYVLQTVPAVLFCWLRYAGYREAVTALVRAGGDTDSTAAILGALMGATYGVESIPQDWADGLRDWPRNKTLLSRLANNLAHSGSPVNGFWPAILPRNIVFLSIVLLHGFRRLLPPYG